MLDLARRSPQGGAVSFLVLSEGLWPRGVEVSDDQFTLFDSTDELSACHIRAATSGVICRWHQANVQLTGSNLLAEGRILQGHDPRLSASPIRAPDKDLSPDGNVAAVLLTAAGFTARTGRPSTPPLHPGSSAARHVVNPESPSCTQPLIWRRSRASPGPLSSSSASARPAMAISAASPGPLTLSPRPRDQSMSVALNRTPRRFQNPFTVGAV